MNEIVTILNSILSELKSLNEKMDKLTDDGLYNLKDIDGNLFSINCDLSSIDSNLDEIKTKFCDSLS